MVLSLLPRSGAQQLNQLLPAAQAALRSLTTSGAALSAPPPPPPPPPPASDLIEVFVNDVPVKVPKGSTALQACDAAGIDIPR